MPELTIADRLALAEKAHEEGRIIQHAWSRTDAQGRHLVCALAAFGNGDINDPKDCPAELMPRWLATLVPRLDDGIASDQVPWFFGGLLDRAHKWHKLDDAAWDRVRIGFMIFAIEDAVTAAETVQPDPKPAYWAKVADACAGVVTALKSGEGLAEAGKAAAEAAEAARWSAAAAAEAARWSAGAARWSAAAAAEAARWSAAAAAAEAARWSAAAAAEAARWSAEEARWSAAAAAAEAARWSAAAAAAEEARWSAAAAAEAAAYKRLAETLFRLIDIELEA